MGADGVKVHLKGKKELPTLWDPPLYASDPGETAQAWRDAFLACPLLVSGRGVSAAAAAAAVALLAQAAAAASSRFGPALGPLIFLLYPPGPNGLEGFLPWVRPGKSLLHGLRGRFP